MILTLVEEVEELLLEVEVQVVVASTKLNPPKPEKEKALAKPNEVGVEQLSVSLAACAGIAKNAAESSKAATTKADLTEREVSLIEIKKRKKAVTFVNQIWKKCKRK